MFNLELVVSLSTDGSVRYKIIQSSIDSFKCYCDVIPVRPDCRSKFDDSRLVYISKLGAQVLLWQTETIKYKCQGILLVRSCYLQYRDNIS